MTTQLSFADADRLRLEWDARQEPFLPHRDEAFAVLADAAVGRRALDLAGGTGSIAARLVNAEVTLLDVDPVLLAIARAAFGDRVAVVSADLGTPGWGVGLEFDAVVAGTALHCFGPDRLRALYPEVHAVLAPGGVFANADRMPEGPVEVSGDDGLAGWHEWWAEALAHPALAEAARDRVDGGSADFYPPASWHLDALREAGFGEVGVRWRRDGTAVVVARRVD
ncbi:methyltransferase family protein [Saccharothrix carnea]|uniref:Methyltransferase family protein n=1 Tax=Saccharothrix carnea TaxID=1280637 RepID=A0A2P8IGY6_SACCR|nr:class I SAM-dependent methyltransferase [Saccharothrix carnea]PSL57731.1 methyltransferase family protein [Saccharothrix carnea]